MGWPIGDLTFFGAVPHTLALGATFEGLFLAFIALETLRQSFYIVVSIKICQFHHMSSFTFIHTLTKTLQMLFCKGIPILSTTDFSGNDRNLLHNKRVSCEMRWHIHYG
jgi:hypothetical protein